MAGLLVVSLFAFGVSATEDANSTAPTDDVYVLEQGEACEVIEPLETDGTVEAFYDYRNHETHPDIAENLYSSYGTQHLQGDDTSILMLHSGTDGTSLVTVHDRLEGQTAGGVASLSVVGTPAEADWVVRDDEYDAPTNMAEWHVTEGHLAADWIWADGRTDGGAIRGGLEEDFSVTIHPAFNEASPLYGDETLQDPDWHGDGRIDEWQLLSGDADDPERITLDLEEPVTIRTGSCADPSISHERTGEVVRTTISGFASDETATSNATDATLEDLNASADDVRFESIEWTAVGSDGPRTVSDAVADTQSDLPDGVAPLSTLAVESNDLDGSGTVSATVDAGVFDEPDLEAADLSLYTLEGGEWVEADDLETSEDAGSYRLEGTVESLEGVAITVPAESIEPANEHTAEESGNDSETVADSVPGGRNNEAGTHDSEASDHDTETAVRDSVWPIAGVGVAVAGLLGVGVWASRRM